MQLSERALSIHQRLLDYYGFPAWRHPLPPIDELVSTILSQNTNDTNRDLAFHTLRKRFPMWEQVRDADPQQVVEAIRSAGLANQKGPRIQSALRQITEKRGELDSPQDARQWLEQFKGVGPKTSAIVLQFSLGMPAFPVDTHIYRVTGRLGIRPPQMNVEKTHKFLADLLPEETYYPLHLNLIRLGREICQARHPKCPQCMLQDLCDYYADNYPSS
jgi:endonuclease-3